jgi:hypothetical protein
MWRLRIDIMQWFWNWAAKRSSVLKSVQRELDAAVDYHSNYSGKIDRALRQPRKEGGLLMNHLREIDRLQACEASRNDLIEALQTDEGVAAWRREQSLNALLRESLSPST